MGAIAAPWAKDATGRRLNTTYTLDGSTLVQQPTRRARSSPSSPTPRVSFGWYIYIRFNPAERREIAAAVATAADGAIGAILCSEGTPVASIVCGAVGAAAAAVVFEFVYDNRRNRPVCGQEILLPYSPAISHTRLIRGDSSRDC